MKNHQGIYYGITPTSESALAFGEMQVMINEKLVSARIAGGLQMYLDHMQLSDLTPMSSEEIVSDEEVRKTCNERYEGFKCRPDGVELIFLKHPSWCDPDIMVRRGMADFLGQTMLWREGRFITYLMKVWVKWCDFRTKGGIPLLSRNGLRARHS